MLSGGCHCGAVRYETDGAPFHETICHCADCRRTAGAASVAWFSVPRARLRFVAEEPRRYHSSKGVTRMFCRQCGTSLTFAQDDLPEIDLTIASLDDPNVLPPHDHTFVRSKLAWNAIGDGLPTYQTTRGSG